MLIAVFAAGGGKAAPPGWQPELTPIFESYLADRLDTTIFLCDELIASRAPEAARRDAAALRAMAGLRAGGRAEMIEARAALAKLIEERPSLIDRPEVALSLGRARTVMFETSAALRDLHAGVEGFRRQGQRERLGEALAALAEAWELHNEWEHPVTELRTPVPATAEEAAAERLRRIEEIRATIEREVGATEAARRTELVLARARLAGPDPGSGEALLEALSESAEWSRAGAEAALALAEMREAAADWDAAAKLYRRVKAGSWEALAFAAGDRLRLLESPQVELAAPETLSPEEPLRVELRMRAVRDLSIEVRRLDLLGWLTEERGALDPRRLPETGSIVTRRGLAADQPIVEAELGSLAAGAYVVIAAGRTADGRRLTDKRLVLATELDALVMIGPTRILVALDAPGVEGGEAHFWVHGAFVPRRHALRDGLTMFDVPGEARVFRDKRWVCLFTTERGMVLCRGELDATEREEVILTGGPSRAEVGETFRVYGVLLGSRPADGEVTIDLVDTYGDALATRTAQPTASGSFSVAFAVSDALAGRSVSVLARRGGRSLTAVGVVPRLTVDFERTSPLTLTLDVPRFVDLGAARIEGDVSAVYPWGTPLRGRQIELNWSADGLPGEAGEFESGPRFVVMRALDERGRAGLDVSLPSLEVEGPRVVRWRASIGDLTGAVADETATTLVDSERVREWIQPLTAPGYFPAGFWIARIDPLGLLADPLPEVTVSTPAGEVRRLEAEATSWGALVQNWLPEQAGVHRLQSRSRLRDGSEVMTERKVEVTPEDIEGLVELRGRLIEHEVVEVTPRGARSRRGLAVLMSEDPLAAAWVDAGDSRVLLKAPSAIPREDLLHVVLLESGGAPRIVARAAVESSAKSAFSAELVRGPRYPGDSAAVRVYSDLPDAELVVRVIEHTQVNLLDLRLIDAIGESDAAQSRFVTGSGGELMVARPAPAGLRRLMHYGDTLGLDRRRFRSGQREILMATPARPGAWRMLVARRDASGVVESQVFMLDTRDTRSWELNAPQRLTVGDRIDVVARAHNPRGEAWEGRLDWDASEHLAAPTPGATSPAVRVRAGGLAELRARFEAARAGSGRVQARLDSSEGPRSATAVIEVLDWNNASDPQIRLTREIIEIEPPADFEPGADDETDRWNQTGGELDRLLQDGGRRVLRPGDPVRVGAVLLIRDRIEALGDQQNSNGELRWTQHAPPHADLFGQRSAHLRQVAYSVDSTRRRVWYLGDELSVGDWQEWVLVAVRAGYCAIPAPEISLDGVLAVVSLSRDDSVLQVVE